MSVPASVSCGAEPKPIATRLESAAADAAAAAEPIGSDRSSRHSTHEQPQRPNISRSVGRARAGHPPLRSSRVHLLVARQEHLQQQSAARATRMAAATADACRITAAAAPTPKPPAHDMHLFHAWLLSRSDLGDQEARLALSQRLDVGESKQAYEQAHSLYFASAVSGCSYRDIHRRLVQLMQKYRDDILSSGGGRSTLTMSPPYLRVDLLEIAAKWTLCGMRPAFAAMMSMPHAVATITQAIVEEVTELHPLSLMRSTQVDLEFDRFSLQRHGNILLSCMAPQVMVDGAQQHLRSIASLPSVRDLLVAALRHGRNPRDAAQVILLAAFECTRPAARHVNWNHVFDVDGQLSEAWRQAASITPPEGHPVSRQSASSPSHPPVDRDSTMTGDAEHHDDGAVSSVAGVSAEDALHATPTRAEDGDAELRPQSRKRSRSVTPTHMDDMLVQQAHSNTHDMENTLTAANALTPPASSPAIAAAAPPLTTADGGRDETSCDESTEGHPCTAVRRPTDDTDAIMKSRPSPVHSSACAIEYAISPSHANSAAAGNAPPCDLHDGDRDAPSAPPPAVTTSLTLGQTPPHPDGQQAMIDAETPVVITTGVTTGDGAVASTHCDAYSEEKTGDLREAHTGDGDVMFVTPPVVELHTSVNPVCAPCVDAPVARCSSPARSGPPCPLAAHSPPVVPPSPLTLPVPKRDQPLGVMRPVPQKAATVTTARKIGNGSIASSRDEELTVASSSSASRAPSTVSVIDAGRDILFTSEKFLSLISSSFLPPAADRLDEFHSFSREMCDHFAAPSTEDATPEWVGPLYRWQAAWLSWHDALESDHAIGRQLSALVNAAHSRSWFDMRHQMCTWQEAVSKHAKARAIDVNMTEVAIDADEESDAKGDRG